MKHPLITLAALGLAVHLATGCATAWAARGPVAPERAPGTAIARALTPADDALLDELTAAHFRYFDTQSEAATGLTRDRSQAAAPASIAAVGFSLTAHGVAVKRGLISRQAAAAYTLRTLRTLVEAPQGPEPAGKAGYKGLFYHFIDRRTAARQWVCELSTIDTALLMAGVLFARNYFDGATADEAAIRVLADRLYRGVDWAWALDGGDKVSLGWHPEKGFLPYHWSGYSEAMLMLVLGLGSPTHPLPAATWETYHRSDKLVERYGQRHVAFGPLFGHQYSQCWLDFQGIADAPSRARGFDWAENSRRATLAQHAYATANPGGWLGYGKLDWGLTACDGPGDVEKTVAGTPRKFFGYMARGAPDDHDDGTIAPTAAAASLPFAPEIVLPTLRHWRNDRPEIWGKLGFSDAFNPTFSPEKPSGWIDPDRLGIDQGPIVLMIENHRSAFVWDVMKRDPAIRQGLARAGFTGGWLAAKP